MADAPTLSPEVSRSVSALARTLVAAARSWALYPPDHPAVRSSLDRLRIAIADTSGGQIFAFGVTPDTLLVAGIAVEGRDAGAIAEAARWLHDRDILQLTFSGEVTVHALQRLLGMLSEDPRIIRLRGGPARVWTEEGDAAIAVQQIDFSQVLEDRDVATPVRRKDDVWRSIVRGILDRNKPTDEAGQARLLAISSDVMAIGELAHDVIAPHCTMDGSPMLTSQAAAVVAAYHHLVGIVDVLSPERRQEVIHNLAAATAKLNPHVVMEMLSEGGSGSGTGGNPGSVVTGVIAALDDNRVAQLLATTLAIEGQASSRLATVFNTIATDDDRKTRVLTLTRRLLSETDFGRQDAFQSLWSSMEALLLTYDERPFVSASYRAGLDQIGARAEQMAAEVPAELAEMVETLGQDNVRRLSVRLLIDLLTLEKDPSRAPELARDVAALSEDLLLAGDYESALAVVTALRDRAADASAVASQSSRVALDSVVGTAAFVETAETFGDMAEAEAAVFADICGRIGAAATDGLKVHLEAEAATLGRTRATAVIKQYGTRAVGRLTALAGSKRWAAQRNVAELLGEIGEAEAVPVLQSLLRGQDPRVTTAAVRALSHIKDPAAARAVHTVLRAATGDQRRAVVDALVSQRDARVVPVLVRIVEESDPFSADHAIVLDTLDALARVGDDQAVPALAALMRKRKFLARNKTRALKERSLAALRGIKTPAAHGAIQEAAKTGDRLLRRLAQAGNSMADSSAKAYDDLVRRLAAAIRGASLYSAGHPLVQRSVDALAALCATLTQSVDSIVMGFIGDEVVVNAERLPKSAAALVGFARDMREREIEKITIQRGVTREELRAFIVELPDRRATVPLAARLQQKGVARIVIGRLAIERDAGEDQGTGMAAARQVYGAAVETAEQLWESAKLGEKPDPHAARTIIDSLAKMVGGDRTSLLALTAVKKYDNYTFTHMVNVSVLAMAQARSLNMGGTLLREFGFAALMHDIGKVRTPQEVLNNPGRLSNEEFEIMQRHVVDGAHILRRTPEMPALAPIVAFEHHLRQDLSGYPTNIGHRTLNLCTQIVTIADVYDALRSNRVYREGLPSDRIKSIMGKKDDPAFNPQLLRRFINLIGLYPVGTLVRLNTEEIGVVTHEHPADPFRPQVKIVRDRDGGELEQLQLVNTWEPDARGDCPWAVVEAVDPEAAGIDPLKYM